MLLSLDIFQNHRFETGKKVQQVYCIKQDISFSEVYRCAALFSVSYTQSFIGSSVLHWYYFCSQIFCLRNDQIFSLSITENSSSISLFLVIYCALFSIMSWLIPSILFTIVFPRCLAFFIYVYLHNKITNIGLVKDYKNYDNII